MSLQHNVPPRSSINGFSRKRVDREIGPKSDNKLHAGKSSSSSSNITVNGGKSGVTNPSRDRLIYTFTYLIGVEVDVHVRNGSIISGIFHSVNAEKDHSIVLKMARVTKDSSARGQKPLTIPEQRPRDMIIQGKDFVQMLAKDPPLNMEEFSTLNLQERRKDLLIDSAISHSHRLEGERELERWTPDADDPDCPELDDIFDGTWNRSSWNQFETNETLFGVKSTFNEEIYTTKLERGPGTRELERRAARIAREIEGEETHDLHLAEERGMQLDEDFDLDEEIKYSAVQRDIDNETFGEHQQSFLNNFDSEAFGSPHSSALHKTYNARSKFIDETIVSSTSSSGVEETPAQIHSDKDVLGSVSYINAPPFAGIVSNKSPTSTDSSRFDENQIKNNEKDKNILNDFIEKTTLDKPQALKDVKSLGDLKDSLPALDGKKTIAESSNIENSSSNELSNPSVKAGASSSSGNVAPASVSSSRGLSPASSIGSMSSEKSSLNPNAKEFKLNPNAKSFTPSVASFRPPPQMPDPSFYYTNNASPVQPMHNMPMGIGIGPSFGGPPPVFNSQSPQGFLPPNGPMYGQPMMMGQPRPVAPVYYMSAYPPEMPFKGRNY